MKFSEVTAWIEASEEKAALKSRQSARALERYIREGWIVDLEASRQWQSEAVMILWQGVRVKELMYADKKLSDSSRTPGADPDLSEEQTAKVTELMAAQRPDWDEAGQKRAGEVLPRTPHTLDELVQEGDAIRRIRHEAV